MENNDKIFETKLDFANQYKEACLLELGTIGFVSLKKRAGKTMTDSAGLSGKSAALNGSDDIELALSSGNAERLVNDELQGLEAEVIVDVTTVDDDGAGALLIQADAGDGGLTTAGAVLVGVLGLIHVSFPPYLISSGF